MENLALEITKPFSEGPPDEKDISDLERIAKVAPPSKITKNPGKAMSTMRDAYKLYSAYLNDPKKMELLGRYAGNSSKEPTEYGVFDSIDQAVAMAAGHKAVFINVDFHTKVGYFMKTRKIPKRKVAEELVIAHEIRHIKQPEYLKAKGREYAEYENELGVMMSYMDNARSSQGEERSDSITIVNACRLGAIDQVARMYKAGKISSRQANAYISSVDKRYHSFIREMSGKKETGKHTQPNISYRKSA